MRARLLAPILFVLVCAPGVARADVVNAPPTDCLDGSRPFTCHGGEGCTPVNCMLDSDCEPGQTCGLRSLCVGTLDCWMSPTLRVVTGACEAAPCAAGSMCVETRYCLGRADAGVIELDVGPAPHDASSPPIDVGSPAPDAGDGRTISVGGCACRVGSGSPLGAALLALSLAMVWALRRHR